MLNVIKTKLVENTDHCDEEVATEAPNSYLLVLKDSADNEYLVQTTRETTEAVSALLGQIQETENFNQKEV